MTGQVLAALRSAVKPAGGSTFANWCALHNFPTLPVLPAIVAKFVMDCQGLGLDTLWSSVREISQAHVAAGLADPTAGGAVASAINAIAKIEPPRSWPQAEKMRFYSLPLDLQAYFAAHEAKREKEIRRAHSEAAKARQALAAIQQPAKETETDGNHQSHAAA